MQASLQAEPQKFPGILGLQDGDVWIDGNQLKTSIARIGKPTFIFFTGPTYPLGTPRYKNGNYVGDNNILYNVGVGWVFRQNGFDKIFVVDIHIAIENRDIVPILGSCWWGPRDDSQVQGMINFNGGGEAYKRNLGNIFDTEVINYIIEFPQNKLKRLNTHLIIWSIYRINAIERPREFDGPMPRGRYILQILNKEKDEEKDEERRDARQRQRAAEAEDEAAIQEEAAAAIRIQRARTA